ncbi:hypothetical protein, partial [Pseudomonas sp. Ga0074129]|uniref:hypothetical protein n=1 Tax=Pseudomonas sp. Ga0074129 TaxID=1752219 RepID=UPI000AC277CB
EDQFTPTQTPGLEDTVRSVCRGERCTYGLNSGPFDFCDPHELPAEEYSDLGLCDSLEYEKTEILRAYGVFQTKHPQEPGCYFSDKPPVAETPSINAEKRSKKQAENAESPSDFETEEESSDDEADEAPSQWSAAPLASALHAQHTDQTSPSIEP